jgi:hypothetical protein
MPSLTAVSAAPVEGSDEGVCGGAGRWVDGPPAPGNRVDEVVSQTSKFDAVVSIGSPLHISPGWGTVVGVALPGGEDAGGLDGVEESVECCVTVSTVDDGACVVAGDEVAAVVDGEVVDVVVSFGMQVPSVAPWCEPRNA